MSFPAFLVPTSIRVLVSVLLVFSIKFYYLIRRIRCRDWKQSNLFADNKFNFTAIKPIFFFHLIRLMKLHNVQYATLLSVSIFNVTFCWNKPNVPSYLAFHYDVKMGYIISNRIVLSYCLAICVSLKIGVVKYIRCNVVLRFKSL